MNDGRMRTDDAVMQKMRGRQEMIFILKCPFLLQMVGHHSDNALRESRERRLAMPETMFVKLGMEEPGSSLGHR